jgi:hypothetical protein
MRDLRASDVVLACSPVEISPRKNALMAIARRIALRFFREIQGCPFFLESLIEWLALMD